MAKPEPSDDELRCAWSHLYSRSRCSKGFENDMQDRIRAGLTRAYALYSRHRQPAPAVGRTTTTNMPRPLPVGRIDCKRAAAGDLD